MDIWYHPNIRKKPWRVALIINFDTYLWRGVKLGWCFKIIHRQFCSIQLSCKMNYFSRRHRALFCRCMMGGSHYQTTDKHLNQRHSAVARCCIALHKYNDLQRGVYWIISNSLVSLLIVKAIIKKCQSRIVSQTIGLHNKLSYPIVMMS